VPTGWTQNTGRDGLIVNGNNVTFYGLFVEHYQQYNVIWNGQGGRTYFFQNELPYDRNIVGVSLGGGVGTINRLIDNTAGLVNTGAPVNVINYP
jgi:hypothetical protein